MTKNTIMIKQKPIIVCDWCGKEVDTKNYVKVEAGGGHYSTISFNKEEHAFCDDDYCNTDCFINDVRNSLKTA